MSAPTSSDLRERVAREVALQVWAVLGGKHAYRWEDVGEPGRTDYLKCADRILAALVGETGPGFMDDDGLTVRLSEDDVGFIIDAASGAELANRKEEGGTEPNYDFWTASLIQAANILITSKFTGRAPPTDQGDSTR